MSRRYGNPRDRHKRSDRDTNQKQLTTKDKYLFYEPTVEGEVLYITTRQQNVSITNTYAMTVVLPSVAEARTKKFVISVTATGPAVTLTDSPSVSYSDSENWGGDYTLDAANDSITLKSGNGRSWTVVSNDIS